jgi:hypothetical protein
MLKAAELRTHGVTAVVDNNEFYKPTPCYFKKKWMHSLVGHFHPRNYRPERQFMRGQTEMGMRRGEAKIQKNGTESNRIADDRARA